jgi:formate dehydrogenase subunit delta
MSQDAQAHAPHVHSHDQTLLRMAGQIAIFFRSYPDAEAVDGIADHINRFWSKKMRLDFIAAFKPDDVRLDARLSKAMGHLRR